MNFEEAIKNCIEGRTGRPCGIIEAPSGEEFPWYNMLPTPGMELSGSMGEPNSIEELIYQIDVVGGSVTQTREAEARLCKQLTRFLVADVPGVMGPPILRKNGATRSTDQVFHRIVIARISVSEEAQ